MKAAFAAVTVLSVSVVWAANQQPPVPRPASFPPVPQPSYDPGDEAVLRSKLRKLVEVKAKTMSAEELRVAIQAMERLGVEPELAPIIDQLRQIEQENAGKGVGRKAQLAIWVLRTQDDPLLGELTNLAQEK